MAFNLRAFLQDKDKYPDTAKVTLADGVETTLGDLRAFQDEQDEGIRGRMSELDSREQVLGRAADEVARARAAIEDMRNNPAAAAENPELKQLLELFQGIRGGKKVSVFEEPGDYFKPLVERLSAISDEIKSAQKQTADTRQDIEKTFAWHLRRQVEREYKSYKDWPEKFGIREAIDYAQKNRLLDEMQYPDWDAVHERVTAPTRQKGELEAERKRIREEERAAARKDAAESRPSRDAFVPLPNGGGAGGAGKAKGYGGIEKVNEIDILNDDTIWNLNGNG